MTDPSPAIAPGVSELFQLLRDGAPRTRAELAKSTGLVLDATGGNYTLIFAACTTVYFLAVLAVHLLSPRLAPVTVESKA